MVGNCTFVTSWRQGNSERFGWTGEIAGKNEEDGRAGPAFKLSHPSKSGLGGPAATKYADRSCEDQALGCPPSAKTSLAALCASCSAWGARRFSAATVGSLIATCVLPKLIVR